MHGRRKQNYAGGAAFSSALAAEHMVLLSCVRTPAGKYTRDNLPGGARKLVINEERVDAVKPLIGLMRDIGSAHDGKTPGQVCNQKTHQKMTSSVLATRDLISPCSRCWSDAGHQLRTQRQ